ncbi:hypothetical protein ACOMHN_019163 [Nucella lapillus]
MASKEENCQQMTQVLTEHRNLDSEAAESSHPPCLRTKDRPPEKTAISEAAAKIQKPAERKRHSEPLPQNESFQAEGKICFERRRLWTASKQGSFELPDEWKCAPEDNVFAEGGRWRQDGRGKCQYQRSFSVPAMLPDIVPEPHSRSENSSPDVVSVSNTPKPQQQPVKSILSTKASVGTQSMLERKQNFEGAVHCEPLSLPQEIRRKRSVTFETVAQLVKVFSPKGIQARSHFLSSGYGSQSDNSQASQGSNVSSERESIFADDIVVEKRSLDINDLSQADNPSLGNTIADGDTDDDEEQKDRDRTQEEPVQLQKEHSKPISSTSRSPQTSKPQTPEVLDEIEIWRRQNNPDFHYGDMDDIPNLSIFDTMKENSGMFFPDTQSKSLSNPSQHEAENSSESNSHTMPTHSSDNLPQVSAESSENRPSPTTKEECQRELYKRLFEDRMLNFDPSKESIGDLFEWVKKNIGEALSPSPRSLFFPAERSPQNEHFKISPGLFAVTNALHLGRAMAAGGGGELLCVPDIMGDPTPPPNHRPATQNPPNSHPLPAPNQPIPNPPVPFQTTLPQSRPPGLGNPWLPLARYTDVINPGLPLACYTDVRNPGVPLACYTDVRNPGLPLARYTDVRNPGVPFPCYPAVPLSLYLRPKESEPRPSPLCKNAQQQSMQQQLQQQMQQQLQQQMQQQQMQQMQQQQQQQKPSRLAPDIPDGWGVGGGEGWMEWAGQPTTNGNSAIGYQQNLPATLDDLMSSMYISSGSEISSSLGLGQVEELVRLSRCSYLWCTDNVCKVGKKSIQSLQTALTRGPSSLSGDDLHLLKLLEEHCNACELPNCPVPWCRFICLRCPSKEDKTPEALVRLLSSPQFTLLPSRAACPFDVFVKLDRGVPVEGMPEEWKDWVMLYPLSQSFAVVAVTPLLPVWPHTHWVIKVASLHKHRNQLEVYKKLRDLRHVHIINHIWIAASYTSEILVICTDFLPGSSVRDLLDQRVRLSSGQACGYWLQILAAAQRLHDLHVIFLNWTCENLGFYF